MHSALPTSWVLLPAGQLMQLAAPVLGWYVLTCTTAASGLTQPGIQTACLAQLAQAGGQVTQAGWTHRAGPAAAGVCWLAQVGAGSRGVVRHEMPGVTAWRKGWAPALCCWSICVRHMQGWAHSHLQLYTAAAPTWHTPASPGLAEGAAAGLHLTPCCAHQAS